MTERALWMLLTVSDLRVLLQRAAAGEDPDLLIVEAHANAVSETVE
jgi:hypothetical protein